MKTIKSFIIFLIFLVSSLFGISLVNKPSLAAQQGINIGALHSQFDQAANLVGPGGWVVVMATPGDCPWLSQMIKNHNVNVIIRGHYPNQHFDGDLGRNWAISWAYTLASMDTGGKKIYFMPLNEPNQTGSGDYQPPRVVVNYTNQLIDQFNKVGIRGSKVILLSPAFNSTHPNIASYIHQIKSLDPNFFNKFDGVSANLYDFEGDPGGVFTSPHGVIPMQNAADFSYIEHNLYDTDKPVYGVEAGVVHPSEGVVYRDEYLKPFVQRAISSLPSVMFAVFSYDPEHQEPWNIFTSQTAAVYRSHQGGGGATYGAPGPVDLQSLIQQAKEKENIQLHRCHQNGCGLAVSQSFCYSQGGGFEALGNLGYRMEPASDIAQAISDPVSIIQSEEIRWPQSGPKKSIRGLFLENFGSLTYPYIRSVARFLAGDLIFQGGSNQTSVLSRLLTADRVDELRYQYWQKCKQGIYCNGRIQDEDKCPNQANECLVFTDQGPLNIDEIPPKPLRKNYRYELNYQQALESWRESYPIKSKYWKQVPIFANPTTLVNSGALSADSCPSFVDQGSTVFTQVSWARTLADISNLLHNLLGSNPKLNSLSSRKDKKELASRVLFSTANSKYLAVAENNDNGGNNNSNSSDPCQQMKQIFWATIKPVVKLQAGGAVACWQFDAGSNDSNYSIGDWGLTVFISANGQTRIQSAPMLGGAANVIGHDHPVHLDCHMGTFGGDVFFSGVKKADEVKVSFQLTGGRCKGTLCGQCDFRTAIGSHNTGGYKCQPPGKPKYRPLPDPNPVAFQIEGHQRLYGPGTTLYCNQWQPETNPDGSIKTMPDGRPVMKCVDGRTSYNVDDPLWLYIAYPYLNTIAQNLIAPGNGVYRIFENNQKTTNDWLEAGTSNITFCASDYDSILKGHFLAMGNTPQELASFNTDVIDGIFLAPYPHGPNQDFFSIKNGHANRGECNLGDSVENVKVYPPYIGGVMNATDTITNCILNSTKENFCQK